MAPAITGTQPTLRLLDPRGAGRRIDAYAVPQLLGLRPAYAYRR